MSDRKPLELPERCECGGRMLYEVQGDHVFSACERCTPVITVNVRTPAPREAQVVPIVARIDPVTQEPVFDAAEETAQDFMAEIDAMLKADPLLRAKVEAKLTTLRAAAEETAQEGRERHAFWCMSIQREGEYEPCECNCDGPVSAPAAEGEPNPNDGGFGEAAYCHHRHHMDEHSADFVTCPHRVCVAARRAAEGERPDAPSEAERIKGEHAEMLWGMRQVHMLVRRALNAKTEAAVREKLPHMLRILEQQAPEPLSDGPLRSPAPGREARLDANFTKEKKK